MRNGVAGICLAGALALFPVWPAALAHHPIQAKFDQERPVTLSGRITEIDWANPHAHLFVTVPEAGGPPVNWAIELASPIDLERGGWEPDTLRIGDAVTIQGIAARDGSDQAWAESVTLASSGRRVFALAGDVFSAPAPPDAPEPAPRWPDGRPRLGLAPGEAGYWAFPSASGLMEDGASVAMNAHGLLANIQDAPRVAPFQPWALALYEYRQRGRLKSDPLFLYCMPPGGPRQFHTPYGVQILDERARNRIFVLSGGGNRNWRLIYTDGRSQVGSITGNDDNPLFYGYSVGHWESDTLVVDSLGFNEVFWFSNGGLPHTNRLHLVERISRPDLHTLNYQVTVDDPGAYTRPWTSTWTLRWVPDEEMPEYYCQDNRL